MKPNARILPRMTTLAICVVVLVAIPAVFVPPVLMQQQGGSYSLNPSLVPGGGGSSSSTNINIAGTIGQAILGSSSGGSFNLIAGFWQAASPCAAPIITSHPSSATACEHASASFSVSATGAGLAYQWRKNTTDLGGATLATLTLDNVGASDAGLYDCVISNPCGSSLTTNAATLTISTYSLSSPGQSIPSGGANGSLNVIVAGTCPWTAVSNTGWITITGGAGGSGSSAVNYVVAANTGAARTGTMTIAGLTFTVIQAAPTFVTLMSLKASAYEDGVLIEWQTGLEVDNLGFNLYRDDAGKIDRVNQQLLAGSALKIGQAVTLGAGYAYSWWDKSPPTRVTQYWLEDVDLSGKSTWHGPAPALSAEINTPRSGVPQARALASLAGAETPSMPVTGVAIFGQPTESGLSLQRSIASGKALKIA
ncbi:MAG TPA: immunoglobulin domain-containing protein, partial [Blastocatellia bacterium]|nr:immunoglobulin domain-containing protein [Blastocatellia bacterium]